jgi:hypothetical protein
VAERDLRARLADVAYTPGRRDVEAIVDLVVGGDDPAVDLAIRALAKIPADAAAALAARTVKAPASHALIRALGSMARAGSDAARAPIVAALGDPARPARVRREAAIALGKIGGDDATAAVLAWWDGGGLSPDQLRAAVEALGKLGGDGALARLAALDPGADAELARRRERAIVMIERTANRDTASAIDLDAVPPAPAVVHFHCRAGLDDLLAAELAGVVETRPIRPGVLGATLSRPLRDVVGARTLLEVGFVVPLAAGDLADAVADALCAPPVAALLRALTRGPVRWRLDFDAGGHKRGVVWRAAQAVRARAPDLINDPTATTWDVVVDRDGGALELVPRRRADDRFAWRVRDVPSASHPTIAAALARIAGARPDDVVWDPFVGSGAELVERARLGAYRALIGSDIDRRALDAAKANVAAAGLESVALVRADARAPAVRGVDLVITNPPLGRRLRGDAAGLLGAALPAFATAMRSNARLVWITPAPARTDPIARGTGLALDHERDVDLGGFVARLQRWTK